MERKIIAISMARAFNDSLHGGEYRIGDQTDENLEVVQIAFKRDGLQIINHRDESGYLIKLVNELDKETAIFKLIPARMVQEITFIEEEEKEQEVKVEKVP